MPSSTNVVSFVTLTAGFLLFKPELISRLEQGQEPWVLDLQGAEAREARRTLQTGEAWSCGTDSVPRKADPRDQHASLFLNHVLVSLSSDQYSHQDTNMVAREGVILVLRSLPVNSMSLVLFRFLQNFWDP